MKTRIHFYRREWWRFRYTICERERVEISCDLGMWIFGLCFYTAVYRALSLYVGPFEFTVGIPEKDPPF